MISRPQPGCSRWCCITDRLFDIPEKPADTAWVAYAPHLTGREVVRLADRWRKATK